MYMLVLHLYIFKRSHWIWFWVRCNCMQLPFDLSLASISWIFSTILYICKIRVDDLLRQNDITGSCTNPHHCIWPTLPANVSAISLPSYWPNHPIYILPTHLWDYYFRWGGMGFAGSYAGWKWKILKLRKHRRKWVIIYRYHIISHTLHQ